MIRELSPENEDFLKQAIERGSYASRADALNEAVELLKARAELLERIDAGTEQLRDGRYAEFDDETLKVFFDDIQAQGKERYDAARRRQ